MVGLAGGCSGGSFVEEIVFNAALRKISNSSSSDLLALSVCFEKEIGKSDQFLKGKNLLRL